MTTTASPTLQFRPCQPGDVEAAVPLIYSSGPEAFRYVFSACHEEQALDFLRMAFVDGRGQFGFHNHTAVIRQDQLVGIGALWCQRDMLSFTLHAARQILSFYPLSTGPSVLVRGLRTERVVRPPRRVALYIGHLGIDHQCRGSGIGTQLIQHFIQRARQQNYRTIALDVADNNPRAQALYERLGFEVKAARPSRLKSRYGHVEDAYYMERPVEA